MIYGAQSWTLTNTTEGASKEILEKKYRLAYDHHHWRIKMKEFIISLNLQIL
jgi:hypothetical protein